MKTKEQCLELINIGLANGASFVELFFDNHYHNGLQALSGVLQTCNSSIVNGLGVRILDGTDELYGYTNNLDQDNLKNFVRDLASAVKTNHNLPPLTEFNEEKVVDHKIKFLPSKTPVNKKTKYLIDVSKYMKDKDPHIVQAIAVLSESEQNVLVASSLGVYQHDLRVRTRFTIAAVAKNEVTMQRGSESFGKSCGLELFDKFNPYELADNAIRIALTSLSAEEFTSSTLPVIITNGFGGVLFHEACGHPLEATLVAKGLSVFSGKLNTYIADKKVSAADYGNMEGEWGYQAFDDEGYETQQNHLIQDGLLVGYLIDYKNSLIMNMAPTGSSRRESYKYSPTSRMNSTFILAGNDGSEEDIIKDTPYALLVKSLSGGSVDPTTGEFNFSCSESYIVKDGKIDHQIRGATLIGQGKDILLKIDKVGNNLALGQGVCGSVSGSVPTDVGQPTIRISSMTVGGTK